MSKSRATVAPVSTTTASFSARSESKVTLPSPTKTPGRNHVCIRACAYVNVWVGDCACVCECVVCEPSTARLGRIRSTLHPVYGFGEQMLAFPTRSPRLQASTRKPATGMETNATTDMQSRPPLRLVRHALMLIARCLDGRRVGMFAGSVFLFVHRVETPPEVVVARWVGAAVPPSTPSCCGQRPTPRVLTLNASFAEVCPHTYMTMHLGRPRARPGRVGRMHPYDLCKDQSASTPRLHSHCCEGSCTFGRTRHACSCQI